MGSFGILAMVAACSDQGLVVQPPEMRVEPQLLDWGEQPPGATETRTFTITNEGPGVLEVTGLDLTGASFTLLSDGRGALAEGESRGVDVVWAAGLPLAQGRVTVHAARVPGREVLLLGATPADGAGADTGPKGEDADDGEVVVGPTGEHTAHGTLRAAGGLDLALLLDTTQSMQALVTAVTDEFEAILDALSAGGRDVRFGLATFEDYPVHPFGTAGVDLPFTLRAPMTADVGALRAALDAVAIHQGQDAPESTMEALRQGLTGVGWDLACDGRYDPSLDVPPYAAVATDAFGGTAPGAGGDAGGTGGFGFGRGRLPVLVYATNYELRDGDDVRYALPGGCPAPAGAGDVAEAAAEVGARLVGVAVGLSQESYAWGQMEALARATGSMADLDGDGAVEPAVLRWAGSSEAFRAEVLHGVEDLLDGMAWTRVRLVVDDPAGVVRGVTPDAWESVRAGQELAYTLHLRALPAGAVAEVGLQLVGAGPGGRDEVLDARSILVRGAEP